MRARAATALLCAFAACAPRVRESGPARKETITVGTTIVQLEYEERDAGAARRVAAALEKAVPCAEQWGRLRVPVTIVLQPSHEALEAAVHRQGYRWLRAWARFDTIDLQSPRTWNLLFSPSVDEVAELLAHELTHCVMYQQAGSAWSWTYQGIPLWFREGMASVTAGQGNERPGREALRAFWARSLLAHAPDADGAQGSGGAAARTARAGDPIADPEPLYQRDAELVYGAAHHAFAFLLERYGADRIRQVLSVMAEGHTFPPAFQHAIGISVEEFLAEFRRYIAWEGWRGPDR
jgi:hypothetical protein